MLRKKRPQAKKNKKNWNNHCKNKSYRKTSLFLNYYCPSLWQKNTAKTSFIRLEKRSSKWGAGRKITSIRSKKPQNWRHWPFAFQSTFIFYALIKIGIYQELFFLYVFLSGHIPHSNFIRSPPFSTHLFSKNQKSS